MAKTAQPLTNKILPKDYSETVDAFCAADSGRGPINVNSTTTVRSSYSDNDYYYRRQGERNPRTPHEIMFESNKAYKDMGLVKQTVDLMSEFACSSIKIQHVNQANEKFYQSWWERVDGVGFSERFLNILYRLGNVPVYRSEVKVSRDRTPRLPKEAIKSGLKANQIPIGYEILNPIMLHVANPSEAMVSGHVKYRMIYDTDMLTSLMQNMRDMNAGHQSITNQLINKKHIDIDSDNLAMFFYKKDDWELWAYPVVYPVLSDIKDYLKMKLADRSALDGAISQVRLWRLGSLEHQIIPNKQMINKLRDILGQNLGGGVIDIVWDETLDFKESNTNVHHFLGNVKYEPILNAIYEGLGIPPALRSGASSMTTNFVSLQTFIRRLEYGRSVLLDFWNAEIKRVQLAMGFQKPAVITFDQMYLGDESAEKRLLIELADRNIISHDTLLEKFGVNSETEKVRVFDNEQERKNGTIPTKASPYHDPQTDHEIKKLLVQQGTVTPSEVGVVLEERKPGEELIVETIKRFTPEKQYKPTGSPSNGRPAGSKDKAGRKKRVQKVMTGGSVSDFLWASSAYNDISKILLPVFLEKLNKGDIRAFTQAEREIFEQAKFAAFANTAPYSDINLDNVYKSLTLSDGKTDGFTKHVEQLELSFSAKHHRQPSYEEKKDIYAFAYLNVHMENNDVTV